MARHSQVQKQVISLYRSLMRGAGSKPGLKDHIRGEFKKNKDIPRTNIMQIEHLVRWGNKKLKTMDSWQSIGVYRQAEDES